MTNDPWASVDPLGQALHFLRMSGTFYCRSEFTAPWGLDLPPMQDCLMFHVLLTGPAWLEVDGAEPCRLQPGDLALVPHGEGHLLRGEPDTFAAPLFDLPREEVGAHYELLRYGGGGAPTTMICGAVRFDHPAARHLVGLLPKLIHVDAWSGAEGEWIQSTVRLMATEARQVRPGGETVITRLADILVIQAIRSWIDRAPNEQKGWLRALEDEQIGRAMAAIHRYPGRMWTVASLASEVAMSRSAFAARFAELVGQPAMHYVARWRMHTALTWLKEDDMPLGDLAGRLGYQSEAAFSRAFKRLVGISPGAARRNPSGANTVGGPATVQ